MIRSEVDPVCVFFCIFVALPRDRHSAFGERSLGQRVQSIACPKPESMPMRGVQGPEPELAMMVIFSGPPKMVVFLLLSLKAKKRRYPRKDAPKCLISVALLT